MSNIINDKNFALVIINYLNRNFNNINRNTKDEIGNRDKTIDYLAKYKLEKGYELLTEEEKKNLFEKLDNLLEAIYLSPTYFPKEIFNALKFREKKLSQWRTNGQITGALTFSLLWIFYKYKFNQRFYFRNFCYYGLFACLSSYLFGRYFEFYGNNKYYREMILKIASDYNITTNEIAELHQKLNEYYLKENQTKSSLDNIKFKL